MREEAKHDLLTSSYEKLHSYSPSSLQLLASDDFT